MDNYDDFLDELLQITEVIEVSDSEKKTETSWIDVEGESIHLELPY